MTPVLAPFWIALLRRGIAVAACLLVLFAASVHFHAEAPASHAAPGLTAGVALSSDTNDVADNGLPCCAISHHCCEAGSLPRLNAGWLIPKSALVAYPVGQPQFPDASGRAPPVEPPRT